MNTTVIITKSWLYLPTFELKSVGAAQAILKLVRGLKFKAKTESPWHVTSDGGLGGLRWVGLELGLDDGGLAQWDGVRSGDGVAGRLLGTDWRGWGLERRRQIARTLLRHLVITRVKEFLLK